MKMRSKCTYSIVHNASNERCCVLIAAWDIPIRRDAVFPTCTVSELPCRAREKWRKRDSTADPVIGTTKLTRSRYFPFTDKRVGRIMAVTIYESHFLFHNNLFQFRQFFDFIQWYSYKIKLNANLLWGEFILIPKLHAFLNVISLSWLSVIMAMIVPTFNTLKSR